MASRDPSPTVDGQRRSRRWWTVLGAMLTVGFVTVVVLSARNAALPVGSTGPTSAMSMGAGSSGLVAVTMTDIGGRTLRLPDGRPGVIVFIKADGTCRACVVASRIAAEAVRRLGGGAALTVLNLDSATSREALQSFARSAGNPPARYVLDDRRGRLSTVLGVTTLAGLVVYDASGRIVGRPTADLGQLWRTLRQAGARG